MGMQTNVDLVVIGTGDAGASAAYAVRDAGWSVAIIDERPFGGTCALRGCDPKRMLVGAAELVDWSRRMEGDATRGESRIVWSELMRFKRSYTDPIPADREAGYGAAGIASYHSTARFVNGTTLRVGDDVMQARHIVIATGAAPARLGIPGEEHLVTSDDFLELPDLPEHVLFVGGGYIAFEFAHIAARTSARPVIIQRGDRALTGFDQNLVSQLVDVTRSIGVEVRLQSEVTAIEKASDGFRVHVRTAGEDTVTECGLAVHAGKANLAGLDLEAAGVTYRDAGVTVNQYLQSVSNPAVYAGGDSADGGGLPLTPVAAHEGDLIARNLLDNNRYTMDFSGLASIVYTIPSLGMAGLTESQAQNRGLRFTVHEGDSTTWYSSRRVRARRSGYRVLVEDDTNRILGAHVLGPHTEELLNVFSLAIRAEMPASKLGDVLFAYPTGSSDIQYMVV
jgi:glutathione reductase (NADPH)